jgi:outer membrane protein assembly factor BamB
MRSIPLALCIAAGLSATARAGGGHGHHDAPDPCDWSQWGQSAAHDSRACARAQEPDRILAEETIDPFAQEGDPYFGSADHLQVPLSDDDGRVFVSQKTGDSADPTTWRWHERGLRWHQGTLSERWRFTSDWRPAPLKSVPGGLFQAALGRKHLYVPGAGGSLFKVDKKNGQLKERIRPFGSTLDPNTHVVGGVTIDEDGNVYYNVVKVDPVAPRTANVHGAWLVKVEPDDHVRRVSYTTLIPDAPAADALCYLTFSDMNPRPPQPWPPPNLPDGSPFLPPQAPCLSQRPPLDATPSVGKDGTIFAATRAHGAFNYSYVVALRPNLTLRWAASLRDRGLPGCGAPDTTLCAPWATPGVDRTTNLPPAAQASDSSSSAPVALPDGAVAYGGLTLNNGGRGHLFKFDHDGELAATFDFGWDNTPGVYRHDGTYSLVVKDNYYAQENYFVTQLDANLQEEWEYEATNTLACERLPDGSISCEDFGFVFEWCIASPGIDKDGTVHVVSADGNLYSIGQGGIEKGRLFLDHTAFAAYTPTSIDAEGRVYGINNGKVFAVGR